MNFPAPSRVNFIAFMLTVHILITKLCVIVQMVMFSVRRCVFNIYGIYESPVSEVKLWSSEQRRLFL